MFGWLSWLPTALKRDSVVLWLRTQFFFMSSTDRLEQRMAQERPRRPPAKPPYLRSMAHNLWPQKNPQGICPVVGGEVYIVGYRCEDTREAFTFQWISQLKSQKSNQKKARKVSYKV